MTQQEIEEAIIRIEGYLEYDSRFGDYEKEALPILLKLAKFHLLAQKLAGLEKVIRESSLCHLCLSNVSEGEREVKELVETIREYLEVER